MTTCTAASSLLPQAERYEILIVQKLESKFSSHLEIFLHLDNDFDGLVSRSDLQNAIINLLGIELDQKQLESIFTRFTYFGYDQGMMGIRYAGFIKYLDQIINEYPTESEYGSTCLHPVVNEPKISVNKEDLLAKVKAKFRSRTNSFKESKAVHLFLQMDEERSGKITIKEFQKWLENNGLVLSIEQCKHVLGSHYYEEGINFNEFVKVLDILDNENLFSINESKDNSKTIEQRLKAYQQPTNATKSLKSDKKSDLGLIRTTLTESRDLKQLHLMELFEKCDSEKTGTLTVNKLLKELECIDIFINANQASSILEHFDLDHDNKFSKSEFVSMVSSMVGDNGTRANKQTFKMDEYDTEAIIKMREMFDGQMTLANEIFRRMDKDNRHILNANKLHDGFKVFGIDISIEHIHHIIVRYDGDEKGNLTFGQFLKLLISPSD